MTITGDHRIHPARATRAAGRATGRFSRMRILSWIAVVLTAGLVAVFAVQIGTFEALVPPPPAAESTKPPARQITVSTSTITGFDREDQPYKVTARTAVQDGAKSHLVHLDTVTAHLKRSSGELIDLAANAGLYDSEARALDLDGDVRLMAADRFRADMQKARVTLADKRFRADVPVVVTMKGGEVRSSGMEITDDGNRILFFNKVKATFRSENTEKKQQ